VTVRNILGIAAGLAFAGLSCVLFVTPPQPELSVSVAASLSQALWGFRGLDVFLQLLIILAGTFSIVTLVKERERP